MKPLHQHRFHFYVLLLMMTIEALPCGVVPLEPPAALSDLHEANNGEKYI